MSCLENDDNNDASIKVRICTITLFIRKLLVVDLWYNIDMFRLWNVFYEFLNEWLFHRNVQEIGSILNDKHMGKGSPKEYTYVKTIKSFSKEVRIKVG